MDYETKRCWAEISLDSIEENYRRVRSMLREDCLFLGVMKSNAYGHGAPPVAKRLQEAGADYFGVAFLDEAIELRQCGITKPILILGHTPPAFIETAMKYDITQTVVSSEAAGAYAEAAKRAGKRLKCHLKVDSGMTRFGFWGEHRLEEMLLALRNDNLDVEGIFSHFAVSDLPDDSFTRVQFEDFIGLCGALEKASGKELKIKHCANSGGMINCFWSHLNMVRAGIVLYGHNPDGESTKSALQPAMSFKTRICQIKEVKPGDAVSYGRTWFAEEPKRIAVLSVGYADGLHRLLSNRADVLIRGKRAPIIGRICMDLTMVDITCIPEARLDDIAVIFGRDDFGTIAVEEQAKHAETVSYELLCAVSARVPRIYL